MSGVPGASCCFTYYVSDDVTYDCGRDFGHDPPHRYVRDYRIDGYGSRTVIEWWDDWANDRATGKRWEEIR